MSEAQSISATVRRCANCAHHDMQQIQGQIMRQMVCVEGPPTMSMIPVVQNGVQGVQGMTHFPVVLPQMYCHRWAERATDDAKVVVVGQ